MDINTLLRNVIASGAASIPVSLVSGQGLGQTAINALATGAGAGIGTPIAGSYGALGGAIGGNVLANVFGTDRNESNINTLASQSINDQIAMEGMMAYNDAIKNVAKQTYDMLPQSKQEQAMQIAQQQLNGVGEASRKLREQMIEITPEDAARVNQIIERIIASQQQPVVVQ
jgi:hypothetical protein